MQKHQLNIIKKTKERLQKRLLKGIKIFLRKKARIWSQAI